MGLVWVASGDVGLGDAMSGEEDVAGGGGGEGGELCERLLLFLLLLCVWMGRGGALDDVVIHPFSVKLIPLSIYI